MYLSAAWNSKNVPAAKNAEPMMGTIKLILGKLVQPNQNREMGSRIAPTIATGNRFSGIKSVTELGSVSCPYMVKDLDVLSSPSLNIGLIT